MLKITHKSITASGKPYQCMDGDEYLNYLKSEKDNLYHGNIGIYISRQIEVGNQKLCFPFIDIDGLPNLHGDDKIESAICNALFTLKILKKLDAVKYFQIIATGGSGFRMFSNILLNYDNYRGFIELVRSEMTHIHDIKPTTDTDMPHQMFVYKGNHNHNKKELVDRHSVVVSMNDFENEDVTPDYYKSITTGKLDPDLVIEFMTDWFDSLNPISDLTALGAFGEKIQQYQKLVHEIKINPFNYLQLRKNIDPIAPDVLLKMLRDKNIYAKVEKRGKTQAISFMGLPCPACKKTDVNARAHPPHYKLKCFNANCPAAEGSGGIPLYKWSGIQTGKSADKFRPHSKNLKAPTVFESKDQARNIIRSEIQNNDDTLLLITPGAGKTHIALETLANTPGKQIIYSCFNRDLQQESYEKIKSFSSNHDRFHLIESRESLCQKNRELKDITSKGFSPAELLCPNCEYRPDCQYYKQKECIGPGVYFVTHHMLQYLLTIFPDPDLIILDENLVSGFLIEGKCSEIQMRSLSTVLTGVKYLLIKEIIALGHQIGDEILRTKSYPMIINGRKITAANISEDSLIGILAKQKQKSEDDIIREIRNLVTTIDQHSKTYLFNQDVDLKAVNWLKGLVSDNLYSFVWIKRNGECVFNTKYITPLRYKNTPVKILDATGDAKAIQALTKRKIKTVKVDVGWNSRKIHIKINTSRGVLKYAKDQDLRKLLSEMISEITADKVMVITYKFLTEKVLKICHTIDPSKEFIDYHFQGPRGINKFQECDAVIVIGLPYSNLNSAGQDAYILFPKDNNIRDTWVDSCMMWELTQNIHRIRPINKNNVEIIIASPFWPPVFPNPDKIIDRSRSTNKKDLITDRLEPFVKEFGFLNSDIGYLANVYLKTKSKAAKEFRRKVFGILPVYLCLNNQNEVKFKYSSFLSLEDLRLCTGIALGLCESEKSENLTNEEKTKSVRKLILVLYILLYYNLLKNENILPMRILEIVRMLKLEKGVSTSKYLSSSNTNQWTELLIDFKQRYPHFESFKIKLPHARGNYVEGVGDKQKVIEFYQQLNDFEIFGNIDVDSYQTKESSLISISPIPEGFISVFVPDNSQLIHIGIKDKFSTILMDKGLDSFKTKFIELFKNGAGKIITNNGKNLAKNFLQAGLGKCEIIDIVLNEKIISNGEVDLRSITPEFIFKKCGLSEDPDISMNVSQLYKVWVNQEKLIQDLGLTDVFELEKRIIWISADIELTGIGIDIVRMLEYQESIQQRINDIEDEIYKMIPRKISLTNNAKLKAHINRTFRLDLKGINTDSLKYVKGTKVEKTIQSILTHRQLAKENKDIERYISLTDNNYRIHDDIEQINTKTGRFYRELQRVKKDGPMRSFFCARDGYKFVVADYSHQEARIMGGLAKDKRCIDIFNKGKDIYLEVAKDITGKTESQCRDFRSAAKKIVLGLNNGQTYYSIYGELNEMGFPFTPDKVVAFIDQYFKTYSGIDRYRNDSVSEAYDKCFIWSALGRHMFVSSDTKTTSLYNFPIQATGADGFKLGLVCIYEKLKDMDAKIVHILHDEVIVEVKEDLAQDVSVIVKKCMEAALERLVPEVPFKVEPEIRDTWGE